MKSDAELTKRQSQVLPFLLACPTYEEAARQAHVSVKQIYSWLKRMSLLGNLDFHYQNASPYVRKNLLGSIFTGKLVFEDGKYRTTGLNEGVALIGLFQKELGNKKV